MAQAIHYSSIAASTIHALDVSQQNSQQHMGLPDQHTHNAQMLPSDCMKGNAVDATHAASSARKVREVCHEDSHGTTKSSQQISFCSEKSADTNVDPEWASFTHDSETEDTPESRRRFSESERRNLLADVDEYDRLSEEDDGNSGAPSSPQRRHQEAVEDAADDWTRNTFVIPPELQNYYVKQFEKLWKIGYAPNGDIDPEHVEDMALRGSDPHVQEFFRKSKLDQTQLSKIWSLADVNTDGYLNLQEFSVAMHLIVRCVKGRHDIPDELPLHFKPPVTPPRHPPSVDVDTSPPSSSWLHQPHGAAGSFGSCGSTPFVQHGGGFNGANGAGRSASRESAGPGAGGGVGAASQSQVPPTFTAQPPRLAQQPKARRATPPDAGPVSGVFRLRSAGPAPLLSPQTLNPPKGPPPRPPPRPLAHAQQNRHSRSASLDLNNARHWQSASNDDDAVDFCAASTTAASSTLDDLRRDPPRSAVCRLDDVIDDTCRKQQSTGPGADDRQRTTVPRNGDVSVCRPAVSSQATQTTGGGDSSSMSSLLMGGGGDDCGAMASTARGRCEGMRAANERLQRQWQQLVETRAALQLQLKKYGGGGAKSDVGKV